MYYSIREKITILSVLNQGDSWFLFIPSQQNLNSVKGKFSSWIKNSTNTQKGTTAIGLEGQGTAVGHRRQLPSVPSVIFRPDLRVHAGVCGTSTTSAAVILFSKCVLDILMVLLAYIFEDRIWPLQPARLRRVCYFEIFIVFIFQGPVAKYSVYGCSGRGPRLARR